MALERLTLASLAEIGDGHLAIAFQQALQRCEDDCRARPKNSKSRKVTLELEIAPMVTAGDEDHGERVVLEDVGVTFKIKDNVPTRQSRTFRMLADEDGGLLWNEGSPDQPRQGTLADATQPETPMRPRAVGDE